MAKMKRSELNQLVDPEYFFWATGIEDTFITAPHSITGRTLDEYELTRHYEKWREDIGLMREIGVTHARYGIPWHRINPQANAWNWDFADKTLEWMLELGIEPIVDLVHYGLPAWIDQAWLNPDFHKYMAEYAHRAAERFKDRIHLWTPLNEPRITAWYCGKLGWWPPNLKGWRGFLRVMMGVCRGMVETTKALRDVDEENVVVQVDATDLYESSDPMLQEEVGRRQEIVFLALDLISGRVTEHHALHTWLLKNGVTQSELDWFQENAIELDMVGINLYPLFSQKVLTRSPHVRIKMPYADGEIVERLAKMYYERYHVPIFISETASLGSVKRRSDWLKDSVASTKRARAQGIPLIGYTWWPLFALVTWAYRQGTKPPEYYIKQMGLWDLSSDAKLERKRTPLVDEFRSLAQAGASAVGTILNREKERIEHVS